MDISMPAAAMPAERPSGALGLPQLTRALRRSLPFIAALACAGAVGGYLYARTLPRTYTAYGSIALDVDRMAIPQLQGALRSDNMPDPLPVVRTEVQALSTRQLVQGVIDKLHLDQIEEFNPALQPATTLDRAKDYVRSLLPQGPDNAAAPGPNELVLSTVTHDLSLFQDNRSLVISIAFTARDPRLAATIVNTLVTDYLAQRSDRRDLANNGADKALVARIAEVKGDLDRIEAQSSALRSRGDIVALRAGSVGQQQVEELATAAAAASVQRTQLEADWTRALALSKSGSIDALAGVISSPTISRLRDQESQTSSRLANLSARYGRDYPGVRSVAADLSAIRSQLATESSRIVTSLGAQLNAARDKEASLTQQLNAARLSGVAAENARAQLDQLSKEADTRRTLYQTLLQSEQQTAAQPAGSAQPDIRVLSAAVPPGFPSGPNTKLMIGMGGLGGMMLGCCLGLLRLRGWDKLNGAPDLASTIGLGILTVFDRRLTRGGMGMRVLASPAGEEAKALRLLRDRLRHACRKGAPRTVLFTPIRDRDRTNDIVQAFARAAAAAGEQVLLIEADLDEPSVARLLNIRSNGLAAVLVEGADWRNEAVVDPLSSLDVLVIDRPLPGGVSLLTGVAMQNLLVEARTDYQLVVLSGAPAASVQAAAMAPRADLTVLVLDSKSGSVAAQDASHALRRQPGSALAAILVS